MRAFCRRRERRLAIPAIQVLERGNTCSRFGGDPRRPKLPNRHTSETLRRAYPAATPSLWVYYRWQRCSVESSRGATFLVDNGRILEMGCNGEEPPEVEKEHWTTILEEPEENRVIIWWKMKSYCCPNRWIIIILSQGIMLGDIPRATFTILAVKRSLYNSFHLYVLANLLKVYIGTKRKGASVISVLHKLIVHYFNISETIFKKNNNKLINLNYKSSLVGTGWQGYQTKEYDELPTNYRRLSPSNEEAIPFKCTSFSRP